MKKPWYKDWKFWTGLTVATLATLPYGGVGGFAFIAAYAGATAISNIYQNYKASKAAAASRPPAQQGERSEQSQEQVLEQQREQGLTTEKQEQQTKIGVPAASQTQAQLEKNMLKDLKALQQNTSVNSADIKYAQLNFPKSARKRNPPKSTSEYAKIVGTANPTEELYSEIRRDANGKKTTVSVTPHSEPPPLPATPPPSTTTATKIHSILKATEGQSAPPPPTRTAIPRQTKTEPQGRV